MFSPIMNSSNAPLMVTAVVLAALPVAALVTATLRLSSRSSHLNEE